MILLAVLFFITALLYASVGFGGGSTYNALLVLHGVDYRILPSIALICNVIVVSGGVYRFSYAGQLSIKRLVPWVVASIPAAWIGGRLPVSETLFIGVLGLSLLAAGLRLALEKTEAIEPETARQTPLFISLGIGAALGFLSGLVGIGGGIFLAPVLYFLRWDTPRAIAGACSFFILVNSLSGLAGQIMKLDNMQALSELGAYWTLFPAVLIGGQIGSTMASRSLNPALIKRLTAVLILYVAARLIWRWFNLAI